MNFIIFLTWKDVESIVKCSIIFFVVIWILSCLFPLESPVPEAIDPSTENDPNVIIHPTSEPSPVPIADFVWLWIGPDKLDVMSIETAPAQKVNAWEESLEQYRGHAWTFRNRCALIFIVPPANANETPDALFADLKNRWGKNVEFRLPDN